MKKILITIIILSISAAAFAQAGLPDSTFNDDGIVMTNIDTQDEFCVSLAVQNDGKIVAGGYFFSSFDGQAQFAIVRYDQDGSPDSSFSSDGIITADLSSGHDYLSKIALYPDNRILAGGIANQQFVIARFKPDGALDSSFNSNGLLVIDSVQGEKYTSCGSIEILADETILAVARSYTQSPVVFKLNSDGSFNTSFGNNGVADIQNSWLQFYDLAIQADGKILLGGTNADVPDGNDFALFRLNTDGSPDLSFGTNGLASQDLTGKWDYAYAVKIQSDGKIILAGYAGDYYMSDEGDSYGILRFTVNGTLDPTFATDGTYLFKVDNYYETLGFDALLDSSDNIFMTGYFFGTFDCEAATIKLGADGTPDPSFGNNGVVITGVPGPYPYVSIYAIAQQPDGKILIGGNQQSTFSNDYTFCLIRYLNSNCAPLNTDFLYQITGLSAQFLNQITEATSFSWDFGDGATSSDQNPVHDFSSSGIYHICLIESDECSSDTMCKDLVICGTVAVDFSFMDDGNTIHFTDASSNALYWSWDFGDGNFSVLQNPSHTFTLPGIYQVCLNAGDDCTTDSTCHLVDVIASSSESIMIHDLEFTISPNPFRNETSINFILPSMQQISLQLFDLSGRNVRTIVNGNFAGNDPDGEEGNHSVQFSKENLSAGIYFLKLKTESETLIKQLIIQ